MKDYETLSTVLRSLLLVAFFVSCGSSASANNESDKIGYSGDAFSIMAPNEGDIPKWIPSEKQQPGFDFFLASSLMAALYAVQIRKRSRAIKKK